MIPYLLPYIPDGFNDYYEPFVGGGAVFFGLDTLRIRKVYLSDINAELMLTWKMVQNKVELLIEALQVHAGEHSPRYFKDIRKQHELTDPIAVASRFIYLNKTCFNGLYRVNKADQFNVPMGSYKKPNICDAVNLRHASKVLKDAVLRVDSFSKIEPRRNDFVYCDPPYDGTFNNYSANGFGESGQQELKKSVDKWAAAGAHVVVSNNDTAFVRRLYSKYEIIEITASCNVNCKANGRGKKPELVIIT